METWYILRSRSFSWDEEWEVSPREDPGCKLYSFIQHVFPESAYMLGAAVVRGVGQQTRQAEIPVGGASIPKRKDRLQKMHRRSPDDQILLIDTVIVKADV